MAADIQVITWTNVDLSLSIRHRGPYFDEQDFIWYQNIFIQRNVSENIVCKEAIIWFNWLRPSDTYIRQ